jgi:hypothetical protein
VLQEGVPAAVVLDVLPDRTKELEAIVLGVQFDQTERSERVGNMMGEIKSSTDETQVKAGRRHRRTARLIVEISESLHKSEAEEFY